MIFAIARSRSLALYDFPKPTIAALPGPAAGAGLSIALACDLRIAARSAFTTTAFANMGLSGDYGASFFLTQLVGTSRARELFFNAERVYSERCEALGIVNRVVPDDRLQNDAFEWARKLASGPTCLAHEAEGLIECSTTQDHRAAVQAFIKKERPVFGGS